MKKVLSVGRLRWFKYFHLRFEEWQRKALIVAGAAFAIPALAFSAWLAVPRGITMPLEVVLALPLIFVVLAVVVVSSAHLRDRVPNVLIDLVAGSAGWLSAILFLRLITVRQLDLGSVERIAKKD